MKKDIKVKPTNSKPKIIAKAGNIPKDAKTIMHEHLINQAKNLQPEFKDKSQENATDYAIDKIEKGANRTLHEAKKAAGKTKDFAVNKYKKYRTEKTVQKEIPIEPQDTSKSKIPDIYKEQKALPEEKTANDPKTKESVQDGQQHGDTSSVPQERAKEYAQQKRADKIKTRESVSDTPSADTAEMPIKTKEEYLKSQGKSQINKVDTKPKNLDTVIKAKQTDIRTKDGEMQAPLSSSSADSTDARKTKSKEYVINKQEQKKALDRAKTEKAESKLDISDRIKKSESHIKTKENYRNSQRGDNLKIKTKNSDIKSFDRREFEADRLKALPKSQSAKTLAKDKVVSDTRIKQRTTSKGTIKTKGKNPIPKPVKSVKGIKTSKKVIKKANPAKIAQKKATQATRKKAAKKAAQEAARRTTQAAKTTAHAVKVAAIKAAQAIVATTKAVVSAIAALGGWAVLLILLIIVIIVAAIAASPFGIFISDEAADMDSIPISSIVAECNVELSAQLTGIEDNTTHNRVLMEGEQASWDEVIAVFAVKIAGTGDETAQDVVVIDAAKKDKLKEVFWDMNRISSRTETVTSGETTETVLYITINSKTKDDMISEYAFNAKQQEALATLLENNDVLLSAAQSLAISDATAKDVLSSLPDSISAERKTVIKAACSLVGKVNYFWGGKSAAIGWDSEWGKMKLVTAEGSRSSGSMRPFGLDCSGFVTWSFINAGFSASDIGHGTQSQVAKGTRISLSSAQAGDLAFYNDISHVGIVAGKDSSGNVLVIHCSSGANNVVITTGGFGFAVRPNCY